MSNATLLMKKYNGFTKQEMVYMFITSVLAGFYLSFDDWGVGEYNVATGLENFLAATFAVFLILATVVLVQKYLGSIFGYKIGYMYSWVGLLVGLFITLVSYGAFPFFLPGGINYEIIKTARLGKFNRSYKYSEMFTIASVAVIIPLFFALLFGSFFLTTETELFRHITIAALLFALFALIPLPQMKPLHKWKVHGVSEIKFIRQLKGGTFGYDLFNFHMATYFLVVLTALVFAGLVVLFQVFSLVMSFVLALVILFVYKVAIPYLQR